MTDDARADLGLLIALALFAVLAVLA